MKRILLITLALVLVVSCTGIAEQEKPKGNPDIPLAPTVSGADDSIDEKLFDVLNLDYPGLEKVKEYHAAGKDYLAAYELLRYYRSRSGIMNPMVNLVNASIASGELNIANQATAGNGYRFYVRNYQESVGDDGLPVYYSFLKDGKIDWKTVPAGLGDEQWLSQKHRHQWMLPQAKAYRATGDEKYVEAWKDIYADWLKAYPVPTKKVTSRDYPWYSLQPSERAIDQISIFSYTLQANAFTPEWLSVFLAAYYDHMICIEANPYYDESSNHRLAQVQALFMGSIMFPELKDAEARLQRAAGNVASQLAIQFNPDGVQNELDPSYHMGVLSNFIDIYRMAEANDHKGLLPDNYNESLKNAMFFVRDIIYPNYTIDNFNDTRSGTYTKRVFLKNFEKYASIFPEDGSFRYMASEGIKGAAPSTDLRLYDKSGYYMFRDGWKAPGMQLIHKNNYNPQDKWHCQPDNGTIGLYRNGRRFLPDAGVFTYGGTSELNATRLIYQSTELHNTLNKNRTTIANGRMLGKYLTSGKTGNVEFLVTENPSYEDLTHRRAIFFVDKKFFVVVDEGYGSGAGFPVYVNWNLCEAANVAIDTNYDTGIFGAHTTFSDGNNMMFKTFCETVEGFATVNTTGYFSDAINTRTQRSLYRVAITKQANLAARFITVIYPFTTPDTFDSINVSASFSDNAGGTQGAFHASGAALQVNVNGTMYDLSYSL